MTNGCAGCHTIDGNPTAIGKIGPNLSHFGSRTTLAAGILPNTPENLAAWIQDPQAIKPGNFMHESARASARRRSARRVPAQPEVRTSEALWQSPFPDHGSGGARSGRARVRRASGVSRHRQLADDRRPQADRHPVRHHGVRLLPDRRRRSADDPHPAGHAERHVRLAGRLQPALHDARHDDDLPLRHADERRVLQLHRAAPDRRARRGVPAPERVQLLDVPVRRDLHEHELLLRRHAGRRLVRLRAADRRIQYSPEPPHRLLDARPADPRRRVAGGRVQLPGDDHQHARAGHDPDAHAGLHLEDAHHVVPAGVRLPGHHRRADPADVRPLLRHELLLRAERRRPAALAAPVLDLRAPRGVHPDPAGDGHGLGDPAGLLARSRCSATRSWSTPRSRSASSASASGATTCSRPASGRSRTRSSPPARC